MTTYCAVVESYLDCAEIHRLLHYFVVILETEKVGVYWLIERPCIALHQFSSHTSVTTTNLQLLLA